jgi:hypothetical protein
MNALTKQELQSALQQITNTICTKTASQQDVSGAIQTIMPKICSKQDMQMMFDNNREKFVERIAVHLRDQQSVFRQMLLQFESLSRRIERLEAKIDYVQSTLNTVQTDAEAVIQMSGASSQRASYGEVY